MTNIIKPPTCPRCEQPLDPHPALSRYDNTTLICTPCGAAEAFWQQANQGRPLPPLDRYLGRLEVGHE